MSKGKGKRQSYTVLKRMRIAFWKANPRCYYCNELTILPTDIPDLLDLQAQGITPDNMATIEHIYTRYDTERFEENGEKKCVLACYKCNHDKEQERASLIPKEELQKRSRRFPLSKFITEDMKKEIIETVFGDREFLFPEQIDSFTVNYFRTHDLLDMKSKYDVQRRYIAGTIKQHMNNIKKQLNDGKQKTAVEETSPLNNNAK